ncbi:MAG: histidine ammonia-lyase [Pseudomonadota bacterium]|nr:histidine ammonia-lyase [Pseudomonadota bacterium]
MSPRTGSNRVVLDRPLRWPEVAAIASHEASLELSMDAKARIEAANAIVRTLVERGVRAYGVNTGVGALSDILIPRNQQSALSRNILMSHGVGVGAPLEVSQTRAIMAAMVNNFSHGHSGLRLCVVRRIVDLLNAGCSPEVPRQGSVGYLTHAAQIGLALIGQGSVMLREERLPAGEALARLGLEPLSLEAKEGLCLVNGTPCATGLACLVLERTRQLMDWADAIAAMSFETQRCQLDAIHPEAMALRVSRGLREVAATLDTLLSGSGILAAARERRTQDALSFRAIPQVHGAVRDVWSDVGAVVNRELESVTDNPIVAGSSDAPQIYSQAHPVGAAVGLAMDQMSIAVAQLGMISERRLDRSVNPLVSGLPAFLAQAGGTASGFMIAQYTAVSLVGENRRLAAPASLDGGITSGLQEDMLCHATPAASKALDIIDNVRKILAIELLTACQSYDLSVKDARPAPRTLALYEGVREVIGAYADDRPLGMELAAAAAFIEGYTPAEIMSGSLAPE